MRDFQSSSSSRPIHIYLSFRGDDNSYTFSNDLRYGLECKGLRTTGDDKKFETGDSIIPPYLLKAIEECFISFVIFSKNLAASIWCLQELSKIAERINDPRHTVIPVFYDVDPNEVRKQTGIYKKAFAEHEKRFTEDLDKVQKWRLAMTQVANLSAFVVRNDKHKQVILDIHRLVHRKFPQIVYADHQLVGMQSRLEEVEKLLDLDSNDQVRVVGICGMSRIGKTTVAAVLYNRICHQFDASYFLPFDASCFLPNVSEVSNSDVVSPVLQFFRETLEMENLEIRDIHEGIFLANPRIKHHKTLIVLDDVSLTQNLKTLNLAVRSNWFGGGSRIIITTRDERVLKVLEVNDICKVKPLAKHEAFQLFCKNAFKCNFLKKQYEEHAICLLEYCGGLPFAIVFLGLSLSRLLSLCQNASELRSALAQVKTCDCIMDFLRRSFDELDHICKQIFLDIACFFTGKEINFVRRILEDCGFSTEKITLLVEKFLIAMLDQRIQMHAMFQEMGREIVRQESPQEPGERSRLWFFDDIYHVMQESTATEKIEAVVLSMEDSKGTTLRVEALSKMSNLRLLIFHNVNFVGTLNYLSNKLRYISWHQYPFNCLPSNFQPHTLIELIMPDSNITQIWEGKKVFPKLKNLNLRGSKNLIKTPHFRAIPNLERLDLEGCTRLLQLHPSIAKLSKLKSLNLRKCINLVSIPNRLFALSSLEILNLACCTKFAYCLKFTPLRSSLEVKLLNNQYCPFLEKMTYFLLFFLPQHKNFREFVCCCLMYLIYISKSNIQKP